MMGRYIKNLMLALLGKDPYEMEMLDLLGKYEKTADRVEVIQELYNKSLGDYNAVCGKVDVLEGMVKKAKQQEGSLQNLVEIMRRRLAEKDALLERQGTEFRDRMERTKREYQERIDQYIREIDGLTARKEVDG